MAEPLSIVVLLSGRGSNLAALLQDSADPAANYRIVAAIADRPAAGLEHARQNGIPALEVRRSEFADRSAFELELAAAIEQFGATLIVLAGFMRVLSAEFVQRFDHRMLNIHPSLLPRYPGLHTHQRAIEAGDAEHGASVHLVIPALDAGPVLAQVRIPITRHDTPEALAQRLLPREHALLCACLRLFAGGWVAVQSGAFRIRGNLLDEALQLDDDNLTLVPALGRTLA